MKRKRIRIAALLLILLLSVFLILDNNALSVSEYTVTSEKIPEAFSGFRIVQISDLHNASFGKGNEKLLAAVENAEPDIIVLTGDLVDSRHTDLDAALDFAEKAVKIAPVYWTSGNHEIALSDYAAFKLALRDRGVTLLETRALPLEQNGETVILSGISDPLLMIGSREDVIRTQTEIMLDLLYEKEEEGYRILLAHHPEYADAYAAGGADLVLSGHAHGGQIRLPFLGGIFAPGQGFFPEYDGGLYKIGDCVMINSRGLGNSRFPLRVLNRPEIVLVTLLSE